MSDTIYQEKKIRNRKLFKRFLWTLLFILVYLFGRSIPVALVPLNTQLLQGLNDRTALDNMAMVTGGQLSRLTLFTLGLSPWMTAMILWRFFTVFGMFKKLSTPRQNRYRLVLTFLLALLQALALTTNISFEPVTFFGQSSVGLARLFAVLVLIAGAFVLMWLGNQNALLGLGGMMIIVLTNMIVSLLGNTRQYVLLHQFSVQDWLWRIGLVGGVLALLIVVVMISHRAEYRIPIRRIGFSSEFGDKSYIPIRLNPAGAMPFMYSISLMTLPILFISLLLQVFPENPTLMYLYQNVGLRSLLGVILYIIILYILSIGFAYYNYDTYEIAKGMQRSGDFIEYIRPGKPTQRYLNQYVSFFAQIGAAIVISLAGLPLLIIVLQKSQQVSLALLVSNIFIVISLVFGIIEQVRSFNSWKQYNNLL